MAIYSEKWISEFRYPLEISLLYHLCFDRGFLITAIRFTNCYGTATGSEVDPYEASKIIEQYMNSGTCCIDRFKASSKYD